MRHPISALYPQSPSRRYVRLGAIAAASLWAVAMAKGIGWIEAYEFAAGRQAEPPAHWPADSAITPEAGKYNLLIFFHGRCPCSTATVGELSKIMTHSRDQLAVRAIFVRPSGMDDQWVHTSLFEAARAIPDVTAEVDRDGIEANRFGAATSGQTVLYDPHGRLVFSGGITASRGHEGDNAGAAAILAALNGDAIQSPRTPVFGCPLSNGTKTPDLGKAASCPK